MSKSENTNVEVGFTDGDDTEQATITLRSFGALPELEFGDGRLNAVVKLTSVDVCRLLDAICQRESGTCQCR